MSNAQERRSERIEECFRTAESCRTRGAYPAAVEALEQAHVLGHADVLVHLRVHLNWMWIAIEAGWPGAATGQILPVLFAAPVSLVESNLGFTLFNRQSIDD